MTKESKKVREARAIIEAHLEPGETLKHFTWSGVESTTKKNFWRTQMGIIGLLWPKQRVKTYFIGLTEKRLILVEGKGWATTGHVESVPIDDVKGMQYKIRFFSSILIIHFSDGQLILHFDKAPWGARALKLAEMLPMPLETYETEKAIKKEVKPTYNAKNDMRPLTIMVLGFLFIILGPILIAILPLGFYWSALRADVSYQTVTVSANDEASLVFDTKEGRYDWVVTSNSDFDAYRISDEQVPAYLAGHKVSKIEEFENINTWTPFLQTGGGKRHILVLVNSGDVDLTARVRTTFRSNPPYVIFCCLPIGLLVSLAGVMMAVFGFARKRQLASS